MKYYNSASGKFLASRSIRRFLLAVVFLTACAAFAGCSGEQGAEGPGKVKVTTTIGMITDIVREVGGEHVTVTGLMPSGIDPHLYKATQGDISKLENADIIFYNGLHLEGKMAEILERIGEEKPTFAVSDPIPRERLQKGDPKTQTEFDPHIWFNVEFWMIAVEKVRDELSAFDPDHKEDYRMEAERYLAQLKTLDNYVKDQISAIPDSSRVLVTAHDAFGYFGKAYGIEVMGLQGISTASEAGTKDVTDLRDLLVERQIKAVFVESSVPKTYIEAVIKGAKEKGHDIAIGGELFSDAMGADGTHEGTYIGMVEHNVNTIVKALK